MQSGDDEFVVRLDDEAQMDDASHYWRDGEGWVAYPPQPSPHHVYDHAAGVWVDPRDPAEVDAQAARDLAACRSAAVAQINAAAVELRARYITVMPGQEMIYLAKEAEALRYLSTPPETLDDFPMLTAEIGLTAPDAHTLAQIWANMAGLWRGVAARIEAACLGAIYRIEAAETQGAVMAELEVGLANRLLDGSEGKMTSSKWAVIAKCSQDTANRDIAALLDLGLLRKGEGGGRSTHYELVL